MKWNDQCARCGADLPLDAPANQRYCSRECRYEAWAEVSRATRVAYNEAKRAERLEAKINRPPCLECGKAIAPEAPANKRFCSGLCADRAYSRADVARRREQRLAERAELRAARLTRIGKSQHDGKPVASRWPAQ